VSRALRFVALAVAAAGAIGTVAFATEVDRRPKCHDCAMILDHHFPRFGGRVLTPAGDTLRFDASECLAAWRIRHPQAAGTLWSADHARPGRWLRVERAHYLLSDSIPSPMGFNLSAWKTAAEARRAAPGRVMRWNETVALVRERWELE
jgi:nitrous oxide reductase accessory protein NosL